MALELRIAIEVVLLILLFLAVASIFQIVRQATSRDRQNKLTEEAAFKRLIEQHDVLEELKQREVEREAENARRKAHKEP